MEPFLKQIAHIYVQKELQNLKDYCFIFPNKRSATFFKDYLAEEGVGEEVKINTLTIGAFVASLSKYKEASHLEQLFILYNEYKKLAKEDMMDFDRFCFWGEMIINDFNDVDRYMVNPEAIFTNLIKYKQLSANYLTKEQVEIIKRYWGEDKIIGDTGDFWNHIKKSKKNSLSEKFLLLWEVLSDLYKNFHERLNHENMTTSGAQYRNAANLLKSRASGENDGSKLYRKRYIFIGFNVLSTSELIIFRKLRDRDIADFYWDMNSPAFTNDFNTAGKFININKQDFPSRYELSEGIISEMPNIEITGIAGNVAQTDYAGETLETWLTEGKITDKLNARDTAVILPDESLFIPLLHTIPEEIENVNVTMGIPMRYNPLSALMKAITILQNRSKMQGDKMTFFYEDILNVIGYPAINSLNPEECKRLTGEISEKRLFRLTPEMIGELCPSLRMIFRAVKDKGNLEEVTSYLSGILETIKGNIEEEDLIGRYFIQAYQEKIDGLKAACERHEITMKESTLFRMIERAIFNEKIHFAGEPLKGLQVIGVPETRLLDFKNVIMLSMNERTFPRKSYSRSFIPDIIRKGFGMPTSDFQENIIAYYFYRLISRAENVSLIYDARSSGIKSGEMSRYLSQLLYLQSSKKIYHKLLNYDIQTAQQYLLSIKKSEKVIEKLKRFTPSGDNGILKNLSASSINTYINCKLEFYLKYVEGYDAESEMHDYIDASTYGTILHDVAEQFYKSLTENAPTALITTETLDEYLKPENQTLSRLVVENMNRLYNKLPNDLDTPLKGEALINGRIILKMIQNMLMQEKNITPIEFVAAEEDFKTTYKVNDKLTVNITQRIDRIDRAGGSLRIVDYKTGGDELKVPSIEKLFVHSSKSYKAIMQIMLYCLIYAQSRQYSDKIKPVIYKMLEIGKYGIENIEIGGIKVEDYREFKDEYESGLKALLEEMFDPSVPFSASEDENSCKFCSFKSICGREV